MAGSKSVLRLQEDYDKLGVEHSGELGGEKAGTAKHKLGGWLSCTRSRKRE